MGHSINSSKKSLLLFRWLAIVVVCGNSLFAANTQSSDPADAVCPRFPAGATVLNPPDVRSHHGVLETTLTFKTAVDANGLRRYCYINENGVEAPTLRAKPGDLLIIHFRNALPATDSAGLHDSPATSKSDADRACHTGSAIASSTNLHFHGMSIPPQCHQDEVLRTAIDAETSFDYRIRIPEDEPPGLYWYHPHIHGFSQSQIQGGASAALILDGIQAYDRSLVGLPERILMIRDQPLTTSTSVRETNRPGWDLSVNYVPVSYPEYKPGVIRVKPGEQQLWRIANAAADTILDLQVVSGGRPQSLRVFSIDGVPIPGGPSAQEDVLLGPGARAEVVFRTPASGETATLITRNWDTGPSGDNDPERPLAVITPAEGIQESILPDLGASIRPKSQTAAVTPIVERRLYFRQTGIADDDDKSAAGSVSNDANTRFYILVDGSKPASLSMRSQPDLMVHQGTVEDWIVTNTTLEDHVFHIHQLHFQVLEVDGHPVEDRSIRDTINVPHRSRNAPPPSVRLRMDFRGKNLVGTFMYQCHIVAHQEAGMMGLIEVLPPGRPAALRLQTAADDVRLRQTVTVTAEVSASGTQLPPAEGTVQFEADGHLDGPPVPLSEGKTARAFSFYSSGIHRIRATYSGDARYEAAQSREIQISAR